MVRENKTELQVSRRSGKVNVKLGSLRFSLQWRNLGSRALAKIFPIFMQFLEKFAKQNSGVVPSNS